MLAGMGAFQLWLGCVLVLLSRAGFCFTEFGLTPSFPDCGRILRC
jgi:hypothetical protein